MKSRLLLCIFLLLSFRVYSQSCTLKIVLSESDPTICSGNSVALTATASGGTAPFTYIWSTGETTSSINVNKSGTYTVSVSDKTPGCQPVTQSITIAASTTPPAPTASGATICPNTAATLTATAPGGAYQWYDSATGGNFLASGATYTTPPLSTPTTFYVETTESGCTSPRTAVNVFFTARPTVTGAIICSGNTATLMVSNGDSYAWYDAATGGNLLSTAQNFTTPPLTASTTYYVVVTTNGCSSAPTPVTATVTPPPPPPTVSNVAAICSGSSANLHANAPMGVFDWFTTPTGGTSLISSPDYTTPPLTATTTYYVQTTVNDCVSQRVPVVVTVDSPPQAPNTQTDTICYNTSTTLTASANPSGTYNWYNAPAAGNLLTTGVTYTTPVLTNSTSYYVQVVNGACTSPRIQINVIVKPSLPAPSVSGAIICTGATAVLTGPHNGGTYQWFNAATGGNLLATDTSYTTPTLTTSTTYYVQSLIAGCISPRSAVTVTVLPPVAAPTASNTSVCYGNSATLTASGTSSNFAWYNSATGGNLLSSGQVFVTPALIANTTYYVEVTNANGCISPRKAVTVTVTPLPSSPTANGANVCYGTSASLIASATGGTIQWYDAATGGNLLSSSNPYNTPALTANTTYYVQNTSGSCISNRTPVTVMVTPAIDPQFKYSSGTFCITSANPTPIIYNPAGGTFSSSAGLVFVSNSTGEINIGASTQGEYVISFAGMGPCPRTTSAKIAIVTTANASFAFNRPYCQNEGNPLPVFPAGATAGIFSASPAGLVFVNTSTGEINLGQSTAGTYTVTNTINPGGTCASSTASATVTIDAKVIVNTGPPQTVTAGSTVQLAGSISGGATTGIWSGGTGTFSNATDPTATYTPGTGETTAKLTLTSADPPGPCGPVSSSVIITFNSQPPSPTAQGTTVCSGSSATLSATAPGGIYSWYDAATGGNLLTNGPSFTTPPLTVTTSYYVETTIGGVTSNRTAVTVTVNQIPAQPTVTGGSSICTGTAAMLTASGSTGIYAWYDAAIGGNLLSNNATYTTPALSFNTSYYVEATINNCTSTRTKVDVTVTPTPYITSAATGIVCSGSAQNYTITASTLTATFNWGRAQVAGISNPAVTNQTSGTIKEILINTGSTPINVTYVITPAAGTCAGAAFNYVVTVNPTPVVTSTAKATICDDSSDNYAVTFNLPGTVFTWSRAAVPGISNAAVSGQSASTIEEVLFNTTTDTVSVTYVFNYQTSTCTGTPFNLVITVNPTPVITSSASGMACGGDPENYVITSNIPSATFNWSRAQVAGISNPAVTNQTAGTINETLINTTTNSINVAYSIIPIVNGCAGTPFKYITTVNPSVTTPVVNTNSPVCVGSDILLSTNAVSGATYSWTGPNGYTSSSQNPDIANATTANSGTYTLVVTAKGCPSQPTSVVAQVDAAPLAYAGPDQVVCVLSPLIILNGKISGGTTTGTWTTSGTGTFSPAIDSLNAQYFPSAADRAAGSVTLTLTSTSKDNCTPSMSSLNVLFGPIPGVNAGPDQQVCSQDGSVQLAGKEFTTGALKWSTSGSGSFTPSDAQLDPSYVPSAADVKSGSVTLTLNIAAGVCYQPADSMVIKFIPPPKVNAGGTRYVLRGNTITLHPVVSTDSVTYLWSPDIDINNVNAKNPVITGDINRTYTLTVTDNRGCVSSDTTFIVVSPEIKINNTFTPNGDGINDYWDITGLVAYVNATVDIFNRYGQKLFHSVGYPKPWDGTYGGQQVPVGVYYYIIDTKVNGQVLSGSVTVIR